MPRTVVWVSSQRPAGFQHDCLACLFGQDYRLNHERGLRMCTDPNDLTKFISRYNPRTVVIAGDAIELITRGIPVDLNIGFFVFHYPLDEPIHQFPIRIFKIEDGFISDQLLSVGTWDNRVVIEPGEYRQVPCENLQKFLGNSAGHQDFPFVH